MSRMRRFEFLGSWFWLIFWLVLFFPIGVIYFVLNIILLEEDIEADEFIEWHRSHRKR